MAFTIYLSLFFSSPIFALAIHRPFYGDKRRMQQESRAGRIVAA
jgi:hypothetical protein